MSSQVFIGSLTNRLDLSDLSPTGPEIAANPSLLAKVSTPALLAFIACRQATGTLVIRNSEQSFEAGIHAGAVSHLERQGGDLIRDAVRHLVKTKVITPEVEVKALQFSVATGKSLIQTLFDMGACAPADLVESIRVAKVSVLDSMVAIKDGSFEWRDGVKRTEKRADPVTINLNFYLMSLMRARMRTLYIQDLEPVLAPYMGKYPVKSKRLTPPIAMMCLEEKERKVLDQIVDGATTLRNVFSMSVLSRNQTARLFIACNFLGFVDWLDTASPKGGIEELENELKKTWERIQREDHFLRLGLHWTSHPQMIEPAYRKMVERWGPNSPIRSASPVCAELSDAIMRLINESYKVLIDKKTRQEYRKRIVEDIKLKFGADFLYKQAHMALFRGEIENAKQIIESVIDILPNPEYLAFYRKITGQGG